MSHFSIFSIARNAMSYHENWQKQWRSPAPKSHYDAIIVGGGTAGAVQMSTVALRALSTATTGGIGNPVVSTGEWMEVLEKALVERLWEKSALILETLDQTKGDWEETAYCWLFACFVPAFLPVITSPQSTTR